MQALFNNKGQTLVETLFIGLILLAILFFIIQLSLLGNAKLMLNTAAYAACRKYVVTYSKDKAMEKARHFLEPALGRDIEVSDIKLYSQGRQVSSAPEYGKPIELHLEVYYAIMPMPLVLQFFPDRKENKIMMKARCAMTME
jgi:hypothetical protein